MHNADYAVINMIYVDLEGRIGNQLFMYAAARALQKKRGKKEKIVINDYAVKKLNWENSLEHYKLKNVEFVHDYKCLRKMKLSLARLIWFFFFHIGIRIWDYQERYCIEQKYSDFFAKHHLILCENGYIPLPNNTEGNIMMHGYFQSARFFSEIKKEISDTFRLEKEVDESDYPNLNEIKNRNTVCISIKVEHNVGNELYDVCTTEYWKKAIEYITENVDSPLFFICSDNVDYVLEHFIDTTQYDAVVQNKDFPVHISLGVMSSCKHFIIGNTSFGWWAQYLSNNSDKIVIAPSKWYGLDVPCDLYQDNWTTIEV